MKLLEHLSIQTSDDDDDGDDDFPLYVDPTNEAYDALDLNRGVETTFLSPAIPWTFGNRLLKGEPMFSEELLGVLGKWKDAVYVPPKQDQAFFQGGAFLFTENGETVYAHYDEATAGHAVPDEMVEKAIDVATTTKAKAEAAAAAASSDAAGKIEKETIVASAAGV